jgi:hypothetical protein
MTAWPVGRRVNKTAENDAALTEPKITLQEMMDQVPPDMKFEEWQLGGDVGREVVAINSGN